MFLLLLEPFLLLLGSLKLLLKLLYHRIIIPANWGERGSISGTKVLQGLKLVVLKYYKT